MLTPIKKILFATTLEPDTRPVTRMAATMAVQFKAKVMMVFATEPLGSYGSAILESYLTKEQINELEQKGQEELDKTIETKIKNFFDEEMLTGPEYKKILDKVIVKHANPVDLILGSAEKYDADLIVIGKVKHKTVEKVFTGSVARKVVKLSKIPVLVVPLT
jgi:nucleotide-binding universal stress UspA family protein